MLRRRGAFHEGSGSRAFSPRRLGSTAAVCSASTRVVQPPISTSDRKLAAVADVEFGATSHVDSGS
jgi:hypothetical protein